MTGYVHPKDLLAVLCCAVLRGTLLGCLDPLLTVFADAGAHSPRVTSALACVDRQVCTSHLAEVLCGALLGCLGPLLAITTVMRCAFICGRPGC